MGKLMSLLAEGLGWVLDTIFTFTGSYGVSIILSTIIVRLMLYPLTLSQNKNMVAMKKLQPEINEIQKKYKDDKDTQSQKMMELYQEHKINPLSGCLPMIIQLPILLAFFRVLRELEFSEASNFLGFWNLSAPDSTLIFPILAAVTTYLQSKMISTDPSQKTMAMMMPIMIFVFSWKLPSGLVLYWIASNVFSIAQQYWINKKYPIDQGGQA